MSLARQLVNLEPKLREKDIDPFASIEGGGLLESADVRAVGRCLDAAGYRDSLRTARLCLQALRVQYSELAPSLVRAELVATLPAGVPGLVRATAGVLQEMLRPPIREIIMLGYELTDEVTVDLLAEAARSGASVALICDRGRGVASKVLDAWPTSATRPRVFYDAERADAAPYASMHAKCLLVDGADLLITSANFTFHGLHGNIEIGVRLSGAPAHEARKIFSHLVESGLVVESCQ